MIDWTLVALIVSQAAQIVGLVAVLLRQAAFRRQDLQWREEYGKLFSDHQDTLASFDARLVSLGSRNNTPVPRWEELREGRWMR